jgi:hypothetical protein
LRNSISVHDHGLGNLAPDMPRRGGSSPPCPIIGLENPYAPGNLPQDETSIMHRRNSGCIVCSDDESPEDVQHGDDEIASMQGGESSAVDGDRGEPLSAAEQLQEAGSADGTAPGCGQEQPSHHQSSGLPRPHVQKIQAGPASASTPVTSHFDALLECLDLLRLMEEEGENVTRQDVIDTMRSMLQNMLSTVMMHTFSTSMSVKGWRVE